jgi:hypothetical protein
MRIRSDRAHVKPLGERGAALPYAQREPGETGGETGDGETGDRLK